VWVVSEQAASAPVMAEAEVDLAHLTASQRPDRYLVGLVGLANSGVGVPVGLLIGSTVIIGSLAPDAKLADALDELMLAVVTSAGNGENQKQPDAEEARATVGSMYSKAARERRETEEKTRERYEAEIGEDDVAFSEMPRDLAREIITNSHVMITLTDVKVVRAGSVAPLELPVMRVNIHQVGAWWTLPVDPATGQASFSIPR
jgi:hypothetical protein